MLFPAEMLKATIGVHKKHQENLISVLHEAGIMEITDIWESESVISGDLEAPRRSGILGTLAEYSIRIAGIEDALEITRHDETTFIHDLFFPKIISKVPVQETDVDNLFSEAQDAITQTEHAIRMKAQISENAERIELLQIQHAIVDLFSGFDFDLQYLGNSRFLSIIPVAIQHRDQSAVHDFIMTTIPGDLVIESRDVGDRSVMVIATLRENEKHLDEVLKNPLVEKIDVPSCEGNPADVLSAIMSEIADLQDHSIRLKEDLAHLDTEWGARLAVLREELEIVMERRAVEIQFGQTEHVTVIEGWVPAKDMQRLETLCETATDHHAFCDFHPPRTNPDGVPIKYDNPPWLRPFQLITTMFARPKYDEIDPTMLIGPILIIYFALMLGDAIYGALIFLLAWLLYRGAGKVSQSVRDMSIILMTAGIATTISGVLQGSYMGDLPQRFFGIEPPFVLLNPLSDPIQFLQIALVIGILHINLGLIIAAYQNIRKSAVREFIHRQVSWFIIQPFAALLLLDFFGWAQIPAPARLVSLAGCGLGIALLLMRAGPLGFFDLTGFLGDWLSYARLLALALATAGIAMTVNILAEMVGSIHPYMFVFALLVLIIGQIFNFALQSLGAFVHSLRLQYVEFFSKFYEGGGREFTPFSARREVTQLVRGEDGW